VGEGIYPILARFADRVSAIDISENVVAAARRRYPELDASACDVRAMPFADATFDVVVSNSTLDHFDTVEAITGGLAELARVVKPGGHLIVSLDNPANPLVALRNALPRKPLERVGLVPYFVGATLDRSALDDALASVGFAVEASTAVMHVPRVAGRALGSLVSEANVPRFARALGRLEWLGRLPTRYLTGQFVVCCAVRLEPRPRR